MMEIDFIKSDINKIDKYANFIKDVFKLSLQKMKFTLNGCIKKNPQILLGSTQLI